MSGERPSCYKCIHRRSVPGDAHSACHHPKVEHLINDPLSSMFGLLGKRGPFVGMDPAKVDENPLGIRGNEHGIRNGWFVWPWNFDPVWLERCDGFEPKEGES